MYLTSPSSKQPLVYYKPDSFLFQKGKTLVSLSLCSEPETEKAYAFVMGLRYYTNESTVSHGEYILSRPKYNSTYSMLWLESDGNLKAHAYYEHVYWDAWEVSFRLFGIENGNSKSECRLLRKCGELGVCDNNQCVACPGPKGLMGWTKSCAPPDLKTCGGGGAGAKVEYFKVRGLAHFLSWYKEGEGPMKVNKCKGKVWQGMWVPWVFL